MRIKARLLLSIAKYLSLRRRPNHAISLPEIKTAARRWSYRKWASAKARHAKESRQSFVREASRWLTFLSRLQIVSKPVKPYDSPLEEFRIFMKEERGLSPITVEYRCRIARLFLDRLLKEKRSLETITASDIDSLVAEQLNRDHYARVSIQTRWLQGIGRSRARPGSNALAQRPPIHGVQRPSPRYRRRCAGYTYTYGTGR